MSSEKKARDYIELQQLLKLTGLVDTGGHAKQLIQSGEVMVNSEVDTRRRRKLYPGDRVEFFGETFIVAEEEEE